jgi:hypothetical protein
MLRVIVILILISAISFFIAKYFWIRTPTDVNIKVECKDGICPAPEEYDE